MEGRDRVDRQARSRYRIAPIHLSDGRDAALFQKTAETQRHYEIRLSAARREMTKHGDVQMVVMIVAEQHQVDRRQLIERHTGVAMACRTSERNRAGAASPDG